MHRHLFIVILFALNTRLLGSLGFPNCPEEHCSQHHSQINRACIAAGMSGKPFPVVGSDGSICTCSCSCVVAETLVSLAHKQEKMFVSLAIGERISTPYHDEPSPIDLLLRSTIRKGWLYEFEFSNGRRLQASANHTVISSDGIVKSLKELNVGDAIRGDDLKSVTVVRKRKALFHGDLYNLVVNPDSNSVMDHIFITEGVQSGDWLLQSSHDQISHEIDLRSQIIEPYPLKKGVK